MWTADNRPRYNRDKLRYPSDLTDAEWAHIEPLIPPGKPGGGKRRVAPRGDQRRDVPHRLPVARLPKDFRSTVHDYLGLWNWDGTRALPQVPRESRARHASSTVRVEKR